MELASDPTGKGLSPTRLPPKATPASQRLAVNGVLVAPPWICEFARTAQEMEEDAVQDTGLWGRRQVRSSTQGVHGHSEPPSGGPPPCTSMCSVQKFYTSCCLWVWMEAPYVGATD